MQNRKKNSISEKIPKKTKTIYLLWMSGKRRYLPDKLDNFDRQWPAIISRLALWRRAWPPLETLDFTIHIGSTPTFSVSFRFVSQHCLRITLRLFCYLDVLMAEMPIKHVFGCFFLRNSPVALMVKRSFSKLREEKTNTFTKLSLINSWTRKRFLQRKYKA